MVLSSVGIVTFLLPSNVVPIPTPITSPLISISLGVANLVAVSALPVIVASIVVA